jgi:hypothetical protein
MDALEKIVPFIWRKPFFQTSALIELFFDQWISEPVCEYGGNGDERIAEPNIDLKGMEFEKA